MAESLIAYLTQQGVEARDALDRFMDNLPMYEKYLARFPSEPTMSRLRDAVAEGDADAGLKAVHTLKGLSGNLGFSELFTACSAMVTEFREGDADTAFAMLDAVEDAYTRACAVVDGRPQA
jgi:HPt (histidine-containing phosphotransfer) domain-containing protein